MKPSCPSHHFTYSGDLSDWLGKEPKISLPSQSTTNHQVGFRIVTLWTRNLHQTPEPDPEGPGDNGDGFLFGSEGEM